MVFKRGKGRPLKFVSPEYLQKKIDEYFESCWTQPYDPLGNLMFKKINGKKSDEPILVQTRPYTITGLSVALDTSRETLLNYENKDEYFDTIKKAKEKCHNYAEEQLYKGKAVGPIFALKNNYGWVDEQTTKHSGLNLAELLTANRERKSSGSGSPEST